MESPAKLRRIVQHFRAHLGQAEHVAPRCNAPWVSAVIEASGDVRPCFFHPVLGNLHSQTLPEILNSPEALQFRSNLDVEPTRSADDACAPSTFRDKTSSRSSNHADVSTSVERPISGYCLKVKSSDFDSLAPTVTFCVCVPSFSCQAVIV